MNKKKEDREKTSQDTPCRRGTVPPLIVGSPRKQGTFWGRRISQGYCQPLTRWISSNQQQERIPLRISGIGKNSEARAEGKTRENPPKNWNPCDDVGNIEPQKDPQERTPQAIFQIGHG